jgi:HAD superfamily 5'-nucleotidase-like hydrolase
MPTTDHARQIFCNRTLNLRAIRAIGYDMDYTLIHYHVDEWERRAYAYLKQKLVDIGWPVEPLEFDPGLIERGVTIDIELGNLVKANRFGYVKRTYHGTAELPFESQRQAYARTIVELTDDRFVFLNTLFDLSKGCMYAQLVDLLDRRELPEVLGYADLYARVRHLIDEAHMEGMLKAEIIADPERFVDLDPDAPLALLDQKHAGKRLLLITNSEWQYTRAMMTYAFDRFLPDGMTWRDLFDVVITQARKPSFFTGRNAVFEVVDDDGLFRSSLGLEQNEAFVGGDAGLVERFLGVSGDQILYVGDHLFSDVHVTKSLLRWRTALVVRELEGDIAAAEAFAERRARIARLMRHKEELEAEICDRRLGLQRLRRDYGPAPAQSQHAIEAELADLKRRVQQLDDEIAPLAVASSKLHSDRWGVLMRAGSDKSLLARQVERHADIYMSRVSSFLSRTPFAFLRSVPGSLPHDRT